MTVVVLDASLAVTALLAADDDGFALQHRLTSLDCAAPHLLDAEVGSVLRRRVAAGALDAPTGESALRALPALVSERFPHGVLAATAWRLRDDLTFYDALYVALAARLGVVLLTADARLARAPGLPCAVEVISSRPAPGAARSS